MTPISIASSASDEFSMKNVEHDMKQSEIWTPTLKRSTANRNTRRGKKTKVALKDSNDVPVSNNPHYHAHYQQLLLQTPRVAKELAEEKKQRALLAEKLAENEKHVGCLNKELISLESELSRLKTEREDEKLDLQNEIIQLNEKRKTSRNNYTAEIVQLKKTNSSLKEKYAQKSAELTDELKRNAELTDELKRMKSELDRLKEEREETASLYEKSKEFSELVEILGREVGGISQMEMDEMDLDVLLQSVGRAKEDFQNKENAMKKVKICAANAKITSEKAKVYLNNLVDAANKCTGKEEAEAEKLKAKAMKEVEKWDQKIDNLKNIQEDLKQDKDLIILTEDAGIMVSL